MNIFTLLSTFVAIILSVFVGLGIFKFGEAMGMTESYALFGAVFLGAMSVLFIYRPSEMGVSTMVYKKKAAEPDVSQAPSQISTQPAKVAASPSREQMHYYNMGYQEGLQVGAQQGFNAASQKVLASLGVKLVEKHEAPVEEGVEKGEEHPPSPSPLPENKKPVHICVRCGHTMDDHQPLVADACFTKGCKCEGYTEKKSWLQKILKR